MDYVYFYPLRIIYSIVFSIIFIDIIIKYEKINIINKFLL